jgi:hypothetical protein
MHSDISKRINNLATLKKYNENLYKLTQHKKSVLQKGFELGQKRITGVNTKKLDNNLSRAKNKIKEYALCNDFKYFVTLTLDPKKYDRTDLKKFKKDLGQFLRDYKKNHGSKIDYVLIPELHKDGNSWHMHGLLSGIIPKHLTKNKNGYMDWVQYSKKFGYMSIDFIKDKNKVSSYITKYINKSMAETIKGLGEHMYYNSNGLNTAIEIKRGTLSDHSIPFDWENDYVMTKIINNPDYANSLIFD